METVPNPGDAAAAKARLVAEFPGWSIIVTDRGRWWATRGPLVREQLNAQASADADTPEQLAEQLRAVTRGRR